MIATFPVQLQWEEKERKACAEPIKLENWKNGEEIL